MAHCVEQDMSGAGGLAATDYLVLDTPQYSMWRHRLNYVFDMGAP